jgi:hypothetical protein
VVASAALLAPIAIPNASAATYCVSAPGCVGTSTDLQSALQAAAMTTDDDVVHIGPVALNGPSGFRYAPGANGGNLSIVGAGTATVLTGMSSFGTVLELDEDASNHVVTVSDLAVNVPRVDMVYTKGIAGARTVIERVVVTSPGTTGAPIGVFIGDGSILRDSTVDVGTSGYAGIEMTGNPAQLPSTAKDSTTIGRFGILVEGGPGRVTRMRVRAYQEGVEACNTQAIVEDTVVQLVGKYAIGLGVQAGGRCGNTPADITATHVTIVGDGSPRVPGYGALQVFADPYAATLEFRHGIVRSVATTLAWRATGSATATIGASDIDLSPAMQYGDFQKLGTLVAQSGNINKNPRFVDAASGDFRLRFDSPGIDAGPSEPFATGESRTDLAGNPRIVDGNGDGKGRRDMGAFEYQHHRPHATAKANHRRRGVGSAFRFSVTATDADPGDTLRIRWKFDDGGKARGRSVRHVFHTRGRHTARVTVTDPTGLKRSITVRVTVT